MTNYQLLRNRKGQSTVEFSLVLLVIIALFCMLSGLAQIAYNWIVLEYAASDASRHGSLGRIEEGFDSREDSIRSRIDQVTNNLGLSDVNIEFFDESGGNSAGSGLEYCRLKLSRTIQLEGMPGFFLSLAGFTPTTNPVYEVTTWTVIRNEPF